MWNIRKRIQPKKDIKRIVVINSKGGSGKSTMATNLCCFFSAEGKKTALADYDPQGSAMRWLRERPSELPKIHGLAAYSKNYTRFTRAWTLSLPADVTRVVIDAPAGVKGIDLDELLEKADVILVPVLPSAIDIGATADFIGQIFLNHMYRSSSKVIGIVANRALVESSIYGKLERFLLNLNIPFVCTFSEHRYYLQAAEQGVGINELANQATDDYGCDELQAWERLMRWIERQ